MSYQDFRRKHFVVGNSRYYIIRIFGVTFLYVLGVPFYKPFERRWVVFHKMYPSMGYFPDRDTIEECIGYPAEYSNID